MAESNSKPLAHAAYGSRTAARAARLPHEVLVSLISRLVDQGADARGEFDRSTAEHDPLPSWAVSGVLLSQNLVTLILDTLPFRECAAARVCSAWSNAWKEKSKRVLQPTGAQPDFNIMADPPLMNVRNFVSSSGNMPLAMHYESSVYLVDELLCPLQSFQPCWTLEEYVEYLLGDEESLDLRRRTHVVGLAIGDDALYVLGKEHDDMVCVRRYSLNDFALLAHGSVMGEDHAQSWSQLDSEHMGLALSPAGFVVVLATFFGEIATQTQIVFLDACTLSWVKEIEWDERSACDPTAIFVTGSSSSSELFMHVSNHEWELPQYEREEDIVYLPDYVLVYSFRRPQDFRPRQWEDVNETRNFKVAWRDVKQIVIVRGRLYALENDIPMTSQRDTPMTSGPGRRIFVADLQGVLLYTYQHNHPGWGFSPSCIDACQWFIKDIFVLGDHLLVWGERRSVLRGEVKERRLVRLQGL